VATAATIRTVDLPEGVEPGLEAAATYEPPGIEHVPDEFGRVNAAAMYTNASHAAVVSVDTGTGRVKVLEYTVAHDCGTAINPQIVRGQVVGGGAKGAGEAGIIDPAPAVAGAMEDALSGIGIAEITRTPITAPYVLSLIPAC
jgi:carbon-monoxide dehydrogenase large subunit